VNRKQIQQVQLHGDFAGRKAVTYGQIKGSQNIAIGRGAQTAMSDDGRYQSASLSEIASRQTEKGLESGGELNQDVQELVQVVQFEAARGPEADMDRLITTLHHLAALAPELFCTVAEWLNRPEMEPDIREVAQRARASEMGSSYSSDFDRLNEQVSNSNLSATAKQRLNDRLARLQATSSRGENGAIQEFRAALQEVIELMPELRQPLWRWLCNSSDIVTPVKIIARRLLTP
jgi:hypothetical protein